ncbi:hypothetical protein AVEN_59309-1 [Araneus ventricosus]|uniref:Uncharacterized protein n=1 Tax=Araneus ventricosus TaxID=182803 RepID=A0A4Y2CNT0_ARAVE|nr:hypothetical protein AVEN_59309-1 [Araneus ventricosus]
MPFTGGISCLPTFTFGHWREDASTSLNSLEHSTSPEQSLSSASHLSEVCSTFHFRRPERYANKVDLVGNLPGSCAFSMDAVPVPY